MTCDDLAKECKAGDKKACALYKKKCGKVKKVLALILSTEKFVTSNNN